MRRLLILLPAVALLSFPAASAANQSVDVPALREAWPGVSRVVLERELRITPMEYEAGLRIAVRTSTAILTEADRDDLNLFTEEVRPGCREPAGIRIEVTPPTGPMVLTTEKDLVQIRDRRGGLMITGPRRGLRAGAVIHESFHVDYSAQCFDEMVSVQRSLGDAEAPVLSETVILDCDDCAAAITGGLTLQEDGERRVLRRTDILPPAPEPHAPMGTRPELIVSTAFSAEELGARVAAALPEQVRRWKPLTAAWIKHARAEEPAFRDKVVQLARMLADVRNFDATAVWKQGLDWGDPAEPNTRTLEPTEWLALATALLERSGGIPVLLGAAQGRRPEGVGSVFDWNEYGVLLPGRGVVTTMKWIPFAPATETAAALARRPVFLLEKRGPRLSVFPADPATRVRSWDTTVEASGSSSLLVSVDAQLGGSRGADLAQRWIAREHAVTKAKGKVEEAARSFTSSEFDKRRLATTTLTATDEGLRIQTAWTIAGGQRRHEGGMTIPVPVPGLEPWIRVLDGQRSLPMLLRARRTRGTVRVVPMDGYRIAGVPPGESVGEGPIRLRTTWTMEGSEALLSWSLEIDADVLPPEHAGDVAAVGAAMQRLDAVTLVLVR